MQKATNYQTDGKTFFGVSESASSFRILIGSLIGNLAVFTIDLGNYNRETDGFKGKDGEMLLQTKVVIHATVPTISHHRRFQYFLYLYRKL